MAPLETASHIYTITLLAKCFLLQEIACCIRRGLEVVFCVSLLLQLLDEVEVLESALDVSAISELLCNACPRLCANDLDSLEKLFFLFWCPVCLVNGGVKDTIPALAALGACSAVSDDVSDCAPVVWTVFLDALLQALVFFGSPLLGLASCVPLWQLDCLVGVPDLLEVGIRLEVR